MAKKSFGKFLAFATVSGIVAAGVSYFLKYKSFNKELDQDFHDFEGDEEDFFDEEEELEDEENDEIYLLEDGGIELDEVFSTACILNLDGKHLCSEDCKGLCGKCGADLNKGPCGCKKELDPRLAVLAKLLDKDSQDQDEEA